MSSTVEATKIDKDSASGVNVLKGLLWREWIAHRSIVMIALAAWLVGGWVLLIFFHPAWILAFGVVYAWLAGQALGGADAAEGSEEFSFSLPPLRSQRYLVRLALGSGTVLLFTGVGVLAIALDLPQMLWGIFVNSGFTEPFSPCKPRFLYALAVACPLGAFAFTFAIATNASSRGLVSGSYLLGGLATGAVVILGFLSEHLLWAELNGFVSCPALLALGAGALLAGYQVYVRKEGISRPAPMAGGSRWWVLAIVLIGMIVGLLFLGLVLFARVEVVENQRIEAQKAAGPMPAAPIPQQETPPQEGRR